MLSLSALQTWVLLWLRGLSFCLVFVYISIPALLLSICHPTYKWLSLLPPPSCPCFLGSEPLAHLIPGPGSISSLLHQTVLTQHPHLQRLVGLGTELGCNCNQWDVNGKFCGASGKSWFVSGEMFSFLPLEAVTGGDGWGCHLASMKAGGWKVRQWAEGRVEDKMSLSLQWCHWINGTEFASLAAALLQTSCLWDNGFLFCSSRQIGAFCYLLLKES